MHRLKNGILALRTVDRIDIQIGEHLGQLVLLLRIKVSIFLRFSKIADFSRVPCHKVLALVRRTVFFRAVIYPIDGVSIFI